MTPDEVYRIALDVYGDPEEARIAAAQMQLETGGGKAMPGNNLFGIKGQGQQLATTEVVGGNPIRTTASFREYPDSRASVVDRLRFLSENPRYSEAGYFDAKTAEEKADALQRAGYATDPNYSAKLKSIMQGGQPTMIPASSFPQFSPQAMASSMQPTAAQVQPSGILGPAQTGPLLGASQPQGLLDRFAPGSGYGYDVATGIANSPGGALTSLAGGFAHAKDRAFERQMAAANGRVSNMPSKTQEVLNLIKLGIPQAQALRMAYPGGTETGAELRDIGGVVYEKTMNPNGSVGWRRIPDDEASRRLDVLETEAGAEQTGKSEASQVVKNREEFRKAYETGVRTIPSQVSKLRQMQAELASGAYGTGPIAGPLKQRFDTALGVLNYEALKMAITRLQGLSTGGITEGEWDRIMMGGPSSNKTVEQNKQIVDDLLRSAEGEYKSLERLGGALKSGDFNPLTWTPELTPLGEIETLDPRTFGAPPPGSGSGSGLPPLDPGMERYNP